MNAGLEVVGRLVVGEVASAPGRLFVVIWDSLLGRNAVMNSTRSAASSQIRADGILPGPPKSVSTLVRLDPLVPSGARVILPLDPVSRSMPISSLDESELTVTIAFGSFFGDRVAMVPVTGCSTALVLIVTPLVPLPLGPPCSLPSPGIGWSVTVRDPCDLGSLLEGVPLVGIDVKIEKSGVKCGR